MKITLVILISFILIVLAVNSYFDARCMDTGADGAEVTISGVYCHYQVGDTTKHETLDWLEESQEMREILSDCLKQNPDAPFMCAPNYHAPWPVGIT